MTGIEMVEYVIRTNKVVWQGDEIDILKLWASRCYVKLASYWQE